MTDSWDSHVLPHGPLERLAPRVWGVKGSLPRGNMPRNMLVHKLPDGGLLIHSAVALNPAGMRGLEELGKPKVLVVPNGFHRLDAAVWKARYPDLTVVAPAGAREKVAQKVAVDATAEEALPPLGITCHAPPGLKPVELAYEIDTGDGRGLIVTDMLFNLPACGGLDGWLFRVLGSTGFFGMTKIGKLFMLKDKGAFRGWLEQLAAKPELKAVYVGHGDHVTKDLGARLRDAAARL